MLEKYTDSADFVYYQRDNNIGGNLDHVSLKVYCPGYFSYQTYPQNEDMKRYLR